MSPGRTLIADCPLAICKSPSTTRLFFGSTRVARGAGARHASTATPADKLARTQKMIGAVGAISNSTVARNLANAAEASSPAPTPIAIVSAPCQHDPKGSCVPDLCNLGTDIT